MVHILSGTNRRGSKSLEVSQVIQEMYEKIGQTSKVMDLCQIPMDSLASGQYGKKEGSNALGQAINELLTTQGLVVVCPEYNGSFPGILKLFIDFWKYPDSFEGLPVAFVGIGGRFGGLRPVEHLQQVFGYRNGILFPQRVFISNVWDVVKGGQVQDLEIENKLFLQAQGFCEFLTRLGARGSLIKNKPAKRTDRI